MSDDILSSLKGLVHELEFIRHVRNKLASVRLSTENDKETFNRMMRLAATTICPECRGYGRTMFGDGSCKKCDGDGNLQGLARWSKDD